MNGFRFVLILLVLSLGGCRSHYYKIDGNQVYLYLKNPEARTVELCGSFDGFKEHGARKVDDETWAVRIPLQAEFVYFYLVDDHFFLPPCRFKEKDDYGSENCIFVGEM